jgi:hypothetical protein
VTAAAAAEDRASRGFNVRDIVTYYSYIYSHSYQRLTL